MKMQGIEGSLSCCLEYFGNSYLDVQVDRNVLWREYGNVDGGGGLLWVDDVALALEDALGEDQDASYYGLVRRRQADLDVGLENITRFYENKKITHATILSKTVSQPSILPTAIKLIHLHILNILRKN